MKHTHLGGSLGASPAMPEQIAPTFEMAQLWRKLSPHGKACLVQVSNYDVEQSVSEIGFHHKTRCGLMVMLGLNLHMRMLSALSPILFSNIIFC